MKDIIKVIIIVITCFIFASAFYYDSLKEKYNFSDSYNTETSIKLNVGDKVNIDNLVKNIDNVKSATFSNGESFKIDEDNNIIANKEGKDSLTIVFEDDSTMTLPIECETTNENSNTIVIPPSSNQDNPKNSQDTQNNNRSSEPDNSTTIINEISSLTIILDNQGATYAGTSQIYEKVVNKVVTNNYYLNESCSNEMTLIKNQITLPKKNTYSFKGYWTKENGNGTLVINESGYFVYDNILNTKTLYALWVDDNTFDEKIDKNRCAKNENITYHITYCQKNSMSNPKCKYSAINGKNENGIVERSKLTTENCGYYVEKNGQFEVKKMDYTKNDPCMSTTEISEGCLISGDITNISNKGTITTYLKHNTALLQNLMNKASDYGIKNNKIAQLYIPEGRYYFTGIDSYGGGFVNEFKSKVKIKGAGESKTIFLPYGYDKNNKNYNGIGMFNNKLRNGESYTTDAIFENFTIDAGLTQGNKWAVYAKGFHASYCKRCVFRNVTVKNTDATCFGIDLVVDSLIENCTAINCGKNAGANSGRNNITEKTRALAYGSSGFGIGSGASNDESLIIRNSTAKGCAKFGFFFENQNRFSGSWKKFTSEKDKGNLVENCISEGNLINYGGVRANDVLYYNNVSKTPRAYDVYFTEQSRRTHVVKMKVDLEKGYKESRKFRDVLTSSFFYDAVKWAQSRGISIGSSESEVLDVTRNNVEGFIDNVYVYAPNTEITRAEAILMLWRSEDRPGKVLLYKDGVLSANSSDKTTINTGFSDVHPNASYAEAINWAKSNNISQGITSTTFAPNSKIKKQHFLFMLFRLDKQKVINDETNEANNWAINIGIIDNANNLNNNITRKEAITMLYRYYKKKGFPYETDAYVNNLKRSYGY